MAPTRPTLHGSRHAVSTGHYLATAAAFSILEAGGNAIDAGCAATVALSVLQPDIVSFGGVAPMIVRLADGRVETIAGVGCWPASIPADLFQREHGSRMPPGVLRTVVPAAPDAWLGALERHGTMTFGEVAAAAHGFAAGGFAVHDYLAHSAQSRAAQYARWPANAALFAPGGQPLSLGDWLVQPALARTIAFMMDEERAAAGRGRAEGIRAARDAFYRGDIARAITAHQAAEGGYLSMEDLAGFSCALGGGIRRMWRGHEVTACEPWCQGPVLLHALLLAEKAGIGDLAHNSADYLHVIAEAVKLAMADREAWYGDPGFVDVPLDRLLSEDNIARQARGISRDRAMEPQASDLSGAPLPGVDSDTSYACVVDRWGNALSATPSDICAHVPIVPELGFAPSARGSQSRTDPSHPNGVAPRKRPRLTPSPAMIVTEKGDVVPFGSPGADVQPQAMLQVLLNLLHFGMEPQRAVEEARIASYGFPSTSYPYEHRGQRLAVEARIGAEVRSDLAARGHEVAEWPEWTRMAGCVELVTRNIATGHVSAAADPRRPSHAIAI